MRCNGMRSYEFVMHCGWLRCHVVWFEMVVWGELEDDRVIRTTQIYSALHSTTKYYSGTNFVVQSTTPVLLCARKYYSSTTPVLLCILLCTTKYYSSTTLQCYSVLQSTTPVLLLVLQSTHLQGAKHQRHQMLCLPRKVTLMIDLRHI